MIKPLIFLLIVLVISLILYHYLTGNIRENLSPNIQISEPPPNIHITDPPTQIPGVIQIDINSAQDNLVYQNAGKIKQQEKNVSDFQTAMENQIKSLSDHVTAFQKVILKNATDISNNAIAIRSSTREIKSAAAAKQAKLDKAGSSMDASK